MIDWTKVRCVHANDDGPGPLLDATIGILTNLFGPDAVFSVVPRADRIAASSALTPTGVPMALVPAGPYWTLDGLPADGLRYVIASAPEDSRLDVAVTGINGGYNLGRCVVNSGTVGAAHEASRRGVSAVALSTASSDVHLTAEWVSEVSRLLERLFAWLRSVPPPVVLNLNLPPVVSGGLVCTYLPVSKVEYDEQFVTETNNGDVVVTRLGQRLVADPDVPDLALLDGGTAVVNLLATPWTQHAAGLVEGLARALSQAVIR